MLRHEQLGKWRTKTVEFSQKRGHVCGALHITQAVAKLVCRFREGGPFSFLGYLTNKTLPNIYMYTYMISVRVLLG